MSGPDDTLTYKDFLDAVVALETYRPVVPPMIIWPNPDTWELFPDLVVYEEEK
jgi:hypothetical protein